MMVTAMAIRATAVVTMEATTALRAQAAKEGTAAAPGSILLPLA